MRSQRFSHQERRQFTSEEKARFDLHTLKDRAAKDALEYCNGNLQDAAALLGIDVRTLYRNWGHLWVNKRQEKAVG